MAASYGRLVRGVSGLSLGGAEDDDAASSASSPSASPRTASAVGAPELRPLQRVASAVLDIPSPEGAPARLALVGPRHVPAPGGSGAGDHAAPACAVEAAPPEAAAPLESPADGLRGRLGPQDFTILALVGQGAFGKVFQVQKRDDGRVLAMKVMRKAHVLEKNADGYARQEQARRTRAPACVYVCGCVAHCAGWWRRRDCAGHPDACGPRVRGDAALQLPDQQQAVPGHGLWCGGALGVCAPPSQMLIPRPARPSPRPPPPRPVNGGHLFYQLYRAGIFEEPLARLYAAEVRAICRAVCARAPAH